MPRRINSWTIAPLCVISAASIAVAQPSGGSTGTNPLSQSPPAAQNTQSNWNQPGSTNAIIQYYQGLVTQGKMSPKVYQVILQQISGAANQQQKANNGPTMSNIHITRQGDAASPLLFQGLQQNQISPHIHFMPGGGSTTSGGSSGSGSTSGGGSGSGDISVTKDSGSASPSLWQGLH